MHWRKVTSGLTGVRWGVFLESVKKLAPGTLWRHNQAGDLPGVGNVIDRKKLDQLVEANKGKRGFTYTHKPMTNAMNRKAVRWANDNGFIVNLSANNLLEADKFCELNLGPVVTLVSQFSPAKFKTPQGRTVLVCPSQRGVGTCKSCKLCACDRALIIGFKPHGSRRNQVEKLVGDFNG
jgi:hypothetical protein